MVEIITELAFNLFGVYGIEDEFGQMQVLEEEKESMILETVKEGESLLQ